MKRCYVILLTLTLSAPVYATDIVDVYGVNPKTAVKIKQRYAKQVRDIETQLMKQFIVPQHAIQNPKQFENLLVQKKQLIETIKQAGPYPFVDLQTVHYPGKKNTYTTIEIITPQQPERLQFISNQSARPHHPQHDLIDQMIQYQNKAMHLLMSNQLDLRENNCPVYHCTVPFTHPELKPYLTVFNQGALKEKNKIINTLQHDPDPERRAAAAFLIGHFKNPQEIITLLSPPTHDPDDLVRNNALRVIGETIARANITEVNAIPFINLLQSPYVTDRNKSLIILLTIADSKTGQAQIRRYGKERLVDILRLQQPNNHDIAYTILKKISGTDFGETNIQGWKQWTKNTYLDKKQSSM